jgi:hypothetical protein
MRPLRKGTDRACRKRTRGRPMPAPTPAGTLVANACLGRRATALLIETSDPQAWDTQFWDCVVTSTCHDLQPEVDRIFSCAACNASG